ncbi:diguanylate cyclase domain-containing protein [Trichothermofontia sp.]
MSFLPLIMESETLSSPFDRSSRLEELNLYDATASLTDPGLRIMKRFKREDKLPGILLMHQQQLVGLISRIRFMEKMSRPYSLELFLNRPIQCLYEYIKTDLLILPGKTLITDATEAAVNRPSVSLYDPIITEVKPGEYRVVDFQELLLAQLAVSNFTANLLTKLYQQLEENAKELERLASLDGLTQIANRRQFDETLKREWHRAIREKQWLTLLLCDVDYFKLYNDYYGHPAGDECLKKIAQTLQTCVQRSSDLVARYGGEEFAIILPNTSYQGAQTIALKMHQRIQALGLAHAASLVSPLVTISVGGACYIPTPKTPLAALLKAADRSLYQAKQQGRNRTILHYTNRLHPLSCQSE